jgi:hypothetical protein
MKIPFAIVVFILDRPPPKRKWIGFVIPGRAKARTGNLEIPGSPLCGVPE